MTVVEFRPTEIYAGYSARCWRHLTGEDLPIELRDTDIPPYECCDCVTERDERIEESLRFQSRMELGIGEFERFGESA
jgi:hypothetical protein